MQPGRRSASWLAAILIAAFAAPCLAQAGAEIRYEVSIPEPEHHWLQVDVTFRDLGTAPLRVRMSRASPGRYATHEFAKNVFTLDAYDAAGRALQAVRSSADEWLVAGHDGSVRVVYRIFGDQADGTYLAVDPTHARMNMPATFLWAPGMESRPIRITFTPPAGRDWSVATQLFPTDDPRTFTAPNLQYFFDSPTELASFTTSRFTVENAGRQVAFRVMAHADATAADVEALAGLIARVVREQAAVFGDLPEFEPGYYTFVLDYMPWVDSDAMEHRNSTFVSQPGQPIATEGGRLAALDAIAHEFFHVWNVERIRPDDLEPFDFTQANVSCCLWLAEGFTQYYGPLTLRRAGLSDAVPLGPAVSVVNGSGRAVRSAVQMSEHAPFADAGVSNDAHDRSRTFISYYTYGSALALALDLSLRERTSGRLSLDDYMKRLWERYGRVPAPAAGYVARPYTLADLRRELADLTGDAAFADSFFDRHVEGREAADYAHLLALAGYELRRGSPSRGWTGDVVLLDSGSGLMVGGGRGALVPFDTPAYAAGLDSGDRIVSIAGRPATRAGWDALARLAPGTAVALVVERRDGTRVSTTMTLGADPALQIVPAEANPKGLDPAARAFRDDWLRSRAR